MRQAVAAGAGDHDDAGVTVLAVPTRANDELRLHPTHPRTPRREGARGGSVNCEAAGTTSAVPARAPNPRKCHKRS